MIIIASFTIGIMPAIIWKLTKVGRYKVYMAHAHGPETLENLSKETGAIPMQTIDLIKKCGIIIVCVPFHGIPDLAKGPLQAIPETTIVVDACNYYPSRDGKIQELEEGLPESVWFSRMIGMPVIKTFKSRFPRAGISPTIQTKLSSCR
jgi:predicted dinucleotide-binding enzyme